MKKIRVIMAGLLVMSVILAGCSSDSGNSDDAQVSSTSGSSEYDTAEDMDGGDYYDEESYEEVADSDVTGAGLSEFETTDRKLIKEVDLDVETREFDEFLSGVRDKISALDGYVQSSGISGNSYEYSDGMRYGYLVARIPAEQMDLFVEQVEASGNVTSMSENVQDVTESYIDTESRKKTLEASQESLLKLLESADSVEAIVTLETRLTEVRSELESLEATLRSYDNLIAYSTIYINITEVARVTEVAGESVGDEIRSRLSDNMYNIGQAVRAIVVWFISSLPYLVPLAGIGAVIGFGIRRWQKKRTA